MLNISIFAVSLNLGVTYKVYHKSGLKKVYSCILAKAY